jgi:hypothetical protein
MASFDATDLLPDYRYAPRRPDKHNHIQSGNVNAFIGNRG